MTLCVDTLCIGCKPLRHHTNFRKPTYENLKERVGSFINLALTLGVHQIKLRHQKLREKKQPKGF